MTVRKLLLELAREPALNFVEGFDLRNGNKDDDGLLASLDVDFSCGADLEGSEFCLEVGDVGFEVQKGLRDLKFGSVRCRSRCVRNSQNLVGSLVWTVAIYTAGHTLFCAADMMDGRRRSGNSDGHAEYFLARGATTRSLTFSKASVRI